VACATTTALTINYPSRKKKPMNDEGKKQPCSGQNVIATIDS